MEIFNFLLLLAGICAVVYSGFCILDKEYGAAISYGALAILDIILAFLS